MPLKHFHILLLLFVPWFINAQETTTLSVYYNSNSYNLSTHQKKSIDSLLNKYAFESINLVGYADTVGNIKANLKISNQRASGIKNYIKSNIPTAKVYTSANGENDNENSSKKLENQRRVDITLTLTTIEAIEETQQVIKVVNPVVDSTKLIQKLTSPKEKFNENLTKNDRIVIENLLFEPGKTIFLYNKIPNELYYLAELMDNNPNMKIIIEGHVCCVDDKKLSSERAKSVYLFLRGVGIDKSRMDYTGFSNSKPLVEEKTAIDHQKNRRVEILVTER